MLRRGREVLSRSRVADLDRWRCTIYIVVTLHGSRGDARQCRGIPRIIVVTQMRKYTRVRPGRSAITDSSLTASTTALSPPGPKRSLWIRWTANRTAMWSIIFSLLWIVGLGSLLGIGLGINSVRRSKQLDGDLDGTGLAEAGIIIGLVGVVLAAIFWSGVAGGNGGVSSPSYIDGSNFATQNYENATSEATLCVASNAQSYDNRSQWMQGCRDGWYVSARSSNNTGMPGLNA